MSQATKDKLIENAKTWFRDELAVAHLAQVRKLKNLNEFKSNPFLLTYLSNFLNGNSEYESLARTLILPRALGTSINTIFGTRVQQFITRVFDEVLGSQIDGMDIEFIDQVDGRKKYCQVKAGPNILNKDDVPQIKEKFAKASRLARTNNLKVEVGDYVFGLLYGEQSQISPFIKEIQNDYTTYIGNEFWYHITGDENFYASLISATGEVAEEFDGRKILNETIELLAKDIEKHDN
jgi:hypothetical protein